ncbi:hypothetical protein [Nonomuraea sp. bgisy101]|uniref:hypothetical protein n=1 Tax=Nonomuraea sp. bgisy101 TaxID=3413784 RepID=UPI003D727707
MLLLGGAVANRDVQPEGLHGALGGRHDGVLELQRQPVAFDRLLLGVGRLVAGGGQRDLGPVLCGDVLAGAPYGDHAVVGAEDGFGDDADVAGAPVTALEPEGGGGRPPVVRHGAQGTADGRGVVVGMGMLAQVLQRDRPLAVLGVQDPHAVDLQDAGQREQVARVVVDHQHGTAGERAVLLLACGLALLLRTHQGQYVARLVGGQVEGDTLAQLVETRQQLQRMVVGAGLQVPRMVSRGPARGGSAPRPSSRTSRWRRRPGRRSR